MLPIPILGSIINTVGTIFSSWQERKRIKAESKVKVEQARVDGAIKHAQSQLDGNLEYDKIAAEGMRYSWKDEYWSIIFGLILISAFLPWTQPYVKEGFIFLNQHTPEWFKWCIVGMIVASFGLKTWNMRKKY